MQVDWLIVSNGYMYIIMMDIEHTCIGAVVCIIIIIVMQTINTLSNWRLFCCVPSLATETRSGADSRGRQRDNSVCDRLVHVGRVHVSGAERHQDAGSCPYL